MENNKIVHVLIACVITAIVMAMPAMATEPVPGETVTSDVTVGNVPPVVCDKWEEPDDSPDGGTQVMPKPCPGAKIVTIYACVCDGNGNEDISSVSAVVKYENGTTKTTVIPNHNSSVDCSGCSCTYPGVECVGYSGTLDMSCCDPPGTYTVNVTVTDLTGATTSRENTFEYLSLIAMTASDVKFGSMVPGGSSTASSTVTVQGNSPIMFVDVDPIGYDNPDDNDGIYWLDMKSDENKIPDDQISTTWKPSTCIPGCSGPTDVSFTLHVPEGTPFGVYAGEITFTPTECLT